jgi:hypothetical protein
VLVFFGEGAEPTFFALTLTEAFAAAFGASFFFLDGLEKVEEEDDEEDDEDDGVYGSSSVKSIGGDCLFFD